MVEFLFASQETAPMFAFRLNLPCSQRQHEAIAPNRSVFVKDGLLSFLGLKTEAEKI